MFFANNHPQENLITALKDRNYFQNILSTAALWSSQRSEIVQKFINSKWYLTVRQKDTGFGTL